MNMHAFDRITRILAAGATRRGVVGGLFGGVVALIAGTGTITAKPGGNGKGLGKGREKTTGNAKGKVWLCHQPDLITGSGTVIQVAVSAKGGPNRRGKLRGHLRHGDVECPVQLQAYRKGGSCTVNAGVATCESLPTGV